MVYIWHPKVKATRDVDLGVTNNGGGWYPPSKASPGEKKTTPI